MYLTVEREIKGLKERVRQLEEEITSVQRQARLALARAEKEAEKFPVLERQLTQTKSNLEKYIKDQAMILAEQQLQQTKASLEHEIRVKECQFNQAKSVLQYEIQMRDQEIAELYQQKSTLQHQTEVKKQAIISAQQFHCVKAIEQARVLALEMQIEIKDDEKAEKVADKGPALERQLSKTKRDLKEQIQMKDQARIEAE